MKLSTATSIFAVGVLLLSTIPTTMAQDVYTTDDQLAINGYDVVNYFTAHEARRGSQEHAAAHGGVTYYFVSDDNRRTFEADATSFLPKYGGYCAFAMAVGNGTVPSDPETFKFYDGELYLFFNDYYEGAPFNTILPWNAGEADLKTRADTNWTALY